MAEWFFTCLRISLCGGVMILAVLLARPLLRKAPRNITCLLWLLVALRLLIPFDMESSVSLQPRILSEPVNITELTPQIQQAPLNQVQQPSQPLLSDPQPELQAPETEAQPEYQPPAIHEQPQSSRTPEPGTLFAMIWLAGSVCLFVYAAVSLTVLQYRVRDAIRCPDGVWESDRIPDAFLLGYWKPRIYLPVGLSQRDRALIVCHERAHQSRGDQWWKLLGLICLSVHWFNPLVWLGFVLMCRDIEAACDEKVIGNLDLSQRKDYSMALLNSGRRISGRLSYPVAFAEVNLKQRIKSVLSYRKPGIWINVAAVTLTLTVAVCFMTNPTTAARSQPEEKLSSVQTTEPTTEEPTAPTTEATEPVTVPERVETLPPEEGITPSEPVTVPTSPAEPAEPIPPEPEPTEPQPTEPPTTEPTAAPTQPTEPSATEPPPPETTEPSAPEPTVPPVTEPSAPEPTLPPVTEPEQESIGGSCGKNAEWEYNGRTGHLAIKGSGSMDTGAIPPWSAYQDQILSVTISNGITSIDSGAFRGCTGLRSMIIPGSVRTIGQYAFANSGIRSILIPENVILIESYAFLRCTSLTKITFIGTPPRIKSMAFSGTAATAYYPEHTGSWYLALNDYGGEITWQLCCTNHSYINGVCERCGSKKGA